MPGATGEPRFIGSVFRKNHPMKKSQTPSTMTAVAIDRFGGVETLKIKKLPIPDVGPDEVLIRLNWAGVGEWDPFEREGGFAKMTKTKPRFPYVLGSEGSGVVVTAGVRAKRFKKGDRVYAMGFLNLQGGFYTEYVVVNKDGISRIPKGMTPKSAAVVLGVGVTALRGLEDTLRLKSGESMMIFGASGGIGHIAVQLAKRMGARVLAIASGKDGVTLARRAGADVAIDGRDDDILEAAGDFAPDGLDAALFVAGGPSAKIAIKAVRKGGRVAMPNGVEAPPKAPAGVKLSTYNGDLDDTVISRLERFMKPKPLTIHVHSVFPLTQVAKAHRALGKHHLGKIALRIR
jgi:NADPH:quinone reductase